MLPDEPLAVKLFSNRRGCYPTGMRLSLLSSPLAHWKLHKGVSKGQGPALKLRITFSLVFFFFLYDATSGSGVRGALSKRDGCFGCLALPRAWSYVTRREQSEHVVVGAFRQRGTTPIEAAVSIIFYAADTTTCNCRAYSATFAMCNAGCSSRLCLRSPAWSYCELALCWLDCWIVAKSGLCILKCYQWLNTKQCLSRLLARRKPVLPLARCGRPKVHRNEVAPAGKCICGLGDDNMHLWVLL